MPPPRVVGLAGRAGVGKSAIATAMEDEWGYERNSFAWMVRDMAQIGWRINTDALDDAKEVLREGGTLTPEQLKAANEVRAKLWAIATGLRAVFPGEQSPIVSHAMWFVDMAVPAKNVDTPPRQVVVDGKVWRPKIVFDDVRRRDEVAAIRERGGVIVWVDGPSLWGENVPATDTDITRADCDFVLDMTKAAKTASEIRSRARPAEAAAYFASAALEVLDARWGFTVHLESGGPRQEPPKKSQEPDDDLE